MLLEELLEVLQVDRVVQDFHKVPVEEETPEDGISVPPVTWKIAKTSVLASPTKDNEKRCRNMWMSIEWDR